MKKSIFLTELKKKEFLKIVDPSDEISKSYLIKSDKCIQVAKLAYEAGIYENAVSEAYYSIYNTITSLFYKCGIKCENHSGAVILMKELFCLDQLHTIFSEFKKDSSKYHNYNKI
ncbi:MAG: HEPN domain-containing protein [Nanoarchaeota archaeon]